MKNNDIEDVIKFMTVLIEGVSHELVNKVATLQMKQQGLQKVFPVLMQGYNLAVQDNLTSEQLSKRILDGVGDLTNLNEQLMPMLEVLDKINRYMEAFANPQKKEEYSIQQCLQRVLEQAFFYSSENLNKIQVMVNEDFLISYPRLFVEAAFCHILHNLLDIEFAKSIRISWSEETNIITITGYQIVPQENQVNMFDRYLYEIYDKSHPGLGFCRQVFCAFGGDIIVRKMDEYIVEYQLVFNVVS